MRAILIVLALLTTTFAIPAASALDCDTNFAPGVPRAACHAVFGRGADDPRAYVHECVDGILATPKTLCEGP